jgi:hypothetical protein
MGHWEDVEQALKANGYYDRLKRRQKHNDALIEISHEYDRRKAREAATEQCDNDAIAESER